MSFEEKKKKKKMGEMIIKPAKRLSGTVALPGDKSISHRAIMLGAIAEGTTKAKNVLECEDCDATIRAFQDMGISITGKGGWTHIAGKGLKGLKRPAHALNVGESGTSMRLLAGILAGQDFESTLEGDASLSKRPMDRIVEPLSLMGVQIRSNGGLPPLTIRGGRVNPIKYEMPVASAQVKSAVLLAGLYAKGKAEVREPFKSRDHTERMLEFFGAKVNSSGLKVSVEGGHSLKARTVEVPADVSSASFFMAGACILPGSKIRLKNVCINPTRAGILKVLLRMGAKIKIRKLKSSPEPAADIEVRSSATKGIVIKASEIPGIIDELPIIFVLAAFSKGKTVINGAHELRVKETDRINSMRENLLRMGARIEISGDDIIIEGQTRLKGCRIETLGDHRTCMAMAIAALATEGESVIDDPSCVGKSFPGFFGALDEVLK